MSNLQPENLNDLLGEGAVESLLELATLTYPDGTVEVPSLTETVWDADGERITWPPKNGRYIMIMAKYEHGIQVSHYSSVASEVYFGNGICNVTDGEISLSEHLEQFRKLGVKDYKGHKAPMMAWLHDWGVEKIISPAPIDLAENFKMMGWEEHPLGESETMRLMKADTSPEGKFPQWITWMVDGFAPESKPDWVN